MKFEVLITPQAEEDLRSLRTFLVEREGLTRADAVMKELKKAVLGLSIAPFRGKEPSELEPFGSTDYFQIIAPPWRIIYYVHGTEVHVLLVADGRRDFSGLLNRRLKGIRD